MISDLYIKKTEDRENFVEKIMEKFASEFKGGKKVFVKPNIVSFENYPTTTHPNLLRKVLEILKENNCKITVGDGPAPDTGYSEEEIIKKHVLYRVCQEFGIELINLSRKNFVRKEGLLISSLPFECEYLISLPVLKCHQVTDLTGALKNHFGFLASKEKILMHSPFKNLHKSIALLHKIIKGDLFIVDAIETYRKANEERWGGIKTKLGYMLAGKDPLALDCYGLELLKEIEPELKEKKPEEIEHLKYAIDLGIGFKESKKIFL